MIRQFTRKMIMWTLVLLTYTFLTSYRVPMVCPHIHF